MSQGEDCHRVTLRNCLILTLRLLICDMGAGGVPTLLSVCRDEVAAEKQSDPRMGA